MNLIKYIKQAFSPVKGHKYELSDGHYLYLGAGTGRQTYWYDWNESCYCFLIDSNLFRLWGFTLNHEKPFVNSPYFIWAPPKLKFEPLKLKVTYSRLKRVE